MGTIVLSGESDRLGVILLLGLPAMLALLAGGLTRQAPDVLLIGVLAAAPMAGLMWVVFIIFLASQGAFDTARAI